MTDEEILEKYKIEIETDVVALVDKYNITDSLKKEMMYKSYAKGFVRGFRKGQKEVQIRATQYLIKMSWDSEKISKVTGLNIAEIESLKQSSKTN
jgi:hypothetical protein